jgi:hypothetical protein
VPKLAIDFEEKKLFRDVVPAVLVQVNRFRRVEMNIRVVGAVLEQLLAHNALEVL